MMLTPAQRIAALIAAADDYLAVFDGPGMADVQASIAAHGHCVAPPAVRLNKTVDAHLAAALALVAADYPALADAIAEAAPHLDWITYDLYDPVQIGADFIANHAYASLIGKSVTAAPDFDLGVFLIAPHILYRDHAHPAPELYAPLTGPHLWRFGPDAPLIEKPAHLPVWNDPDGPHMTKVGPRPFLAIYCWTRDTDKPAQVIAATDWAALEALRMDDRGDKDLPVATQIHPAADLA